MIKESKKSASIKLEGYNMLNAKAIAILSGGYNKYGRKIDIKRYEHFKKQFDNLMFNINYELDK